MSSLKIGMRLAAAFSILVGLLILISGIAALKLGSLNQATATLASNRVPTLIMLDRLNVSTLNAARHLRDILILDDSDQIKSQIEGIAKTKEETREALQFLDTQLQEGQGAEILAEAKKAHEEYVGPEDAFVRLVQSGDISAAKIVLLVSVRERQAEYIGSLGKLTAFETEQAKASATIAEKSYRSGLLQIGILALGAIVAGSLLGLLIARSIARPLDRAVGFAEAIAKGDLSQSIQARGRDETAQLLQALGKMQENLKQVIGQIGDNAQQVLRASGSLIQSAREVATASEQQSDAAASMAASVEEISVGMDQTTGHSKSMQALSEENGHNAQEGGEVIGQVIADMHRISETVRASSQVIASLDQQSQEIYQVTHVIKDIAEQTNLLALNAAIEAARAGEQGRGFAVVADEVRKLAERASSSTDRITTLLESVRSMTQTAVETMNRSVSAVENGTALADRASARMEAIRHSADQVGSSVTGIADSLREQTAATTEIAKSVERIARMAEDNSQKAAGSVEVSNRLEQTARQLETAVSHFRT